MPGDKEKVTKKIETKHPRAAIPISNIVRDWHPLFEQLQDTVEWALDLARDSRATTKTIESSARERLHDLNEALDDRRFGRPDAKPTRIGFAASYADGSSH